MRSSQKRRRSQGNVDKIEAMKVKYRDQVEILDNDTIVMHHFLVGAKLYKSELMQAQVEAEVNNMGIM